MGVLAKRYNDLNGEVNDQFDKLTNGKKINIIGQQLKDENIKFDKNLSIDDQLELYNTEGFNVWDLPQVQFYNRRDRYDSCYITHVDNGTIHGFDDDFDKVKIGWSNTTDTGYNIDLVEYLEEISIGKKVKEFINKLD